ncbi:MAG: AAA family ATPase [Rhizobiaceae bacterium]
MTERVRRWLTAFAEAKAAQLTLPTGPGFILTPTAKKLTEALLYAQTMPEFTIATMGAGVGKTMTARNYVATRPHAYLVTMRPSTAARHAMLQELALSLDVFERNPARLDRAIGAKLKRNGRHTLLILDEAQNLSDEAVNQLRFLNDEYGCGIALLGNEAVYRRFGTMLNDDRHDDASAQIQRRIGLRILQRQPVSADIDAYLDGWSIEDADCRRLGHAIARKPGAIGQLDKVLRLAHMIAVGADEAFSPLHIRKAWSNRSGEELR